MIRKMFGKLHFLVINIFIIACLWIMISTNLRISVSEIFSKMFPVSKSSTFANTVVHHVKRVDWQLNYLAWAAGLKNYWRMFSPVDRMNWMMKFYGNYSDGSKVLLPLPHVTNRNFWQKYLVDFRETKFYVNIYNNKTVQNYYAEYLCKKYSNFGGNLVSIQSELDWSPILSPQETNQLNSYPEPYTYTRSLDSYKC